MTPSEKVAAGERALARRDAVMRRLIRQAGPADLGRRRSRSHFDELVRSIMYQQLAGRAAAAIHARLLALFEEEGLSPEAVLAMPERRLRTAGLSGAKAASVRDLAAKSLDGTVPLRGFARLPDDEVVQRLSTVRGIGRWTAEMFLMFQLGRLDVWPVGDYGVRNGYRIAYGLSSMPSAKELEPKGEPYRPYRSIAAWYCWQAVHIERGD
ncbi:MAG: DNA-3-methyladenine glycosylase 2 family protein [Actinobacteria bacterium]|nr:DNA-3-methyladenine glycosylase 2 family protein [Actinomycetota bacterium]